MLPVVLTNHVKLQTDQQQLPDKEKFVCSMEIDKFLLEKSCSKFKVFQKNKLDFNVFCDPLEVQQIEILLSEFPSKHLYSLPKYLIVGT